MKTRSLIHLEVVIFSIFHSEAQKSPSTCPGHASRWNGRGHIHTAHFGVLSLNQKSGVVVFRKTCGLKGSLLETVGLSVASLSAVD
jgi:hypothetical protein